MLTLITLIAAAHLLWGGTVIGQDSATQFYPWFDYLGERLASGEIPGWNPYQFAGVPFAADPQSGWMYLPAMVVFTLLPLQAAIPVFIVFHLALAGAGTYVLTRLLGIGAGGALFAAVAYEFSGPVYGRSVCCPAQYEVSAWLPAALIGTELALRSRDAGWRVIGWCLAALAVSQALGAWLGQGAYYFLLVVAAYIAWRALLAPHDRSVPWGGRVRAALLHGSVVMAGGFGLAAAGILPRVDYISRSNLAGGDYGDAGSWASSIGGVTPTMIADRLFDPGLYYPGVITAVLACACLFLTRGRNGTAFFAGIGICALILAIPWTSPLHRLLYLVLPRFEELHQHWPDRVAIVAYLPFAVLAGGAVDVLASGRFDARRVTLAVGVPVGVAAVLVLASDDILPVPLLATLLTAGLVALAVLPAVRSMRPALPVLAVAVLALDLLVAFNGVAAQGPYGGFHRVEIADYYARTGAVDFLAERSGESPARYIGYDPELRVIADDQIVLYRYQFASPATTELLVNNRGVLHGIEDAQGYNPVQPRRFVEYVTALNGQPQEYHDANTYRPGLDSPLLDLLNVRYIVIPAGHEAQRADLRELNRTFATVYTDDQVSILENTEAVPRAWIVHEARQVETEDLLSLLASGTVDPRTVALLETTPPDLGPVDGDGADSVTELDRGPDEMRFRTKTAAPGLLMLSETADPHWRAWVDGEEVDLYTANYLFRAVPIPAGEHTIELRYESAWLQAGLGISATCAVVLVVGLSWAGRRFWRGRDHDIGAT